MSDDRRQRIERRANEIWQREGRPDGRADQHWRLATAEIEAEEAAAEVSLASAAPVPEATPEPQPAAAMEAGDVPSAKASAKRTGKSRAAGAKAGVANADETKKAARKKKS